MTKVEIYTWTYCPYCIKAKELLENSHLKIYEIANHVGYRDEKYFSKLFKKLIGIRPNEYRNMKIKVK